MKIIWGRGHKQKGAYVPSQIMETHFSKCFYAYIKWYFCHNYPSNYHASYIQVKNDDADENRNKLLMKRVLWARVGCN